MDEMRFITEVVHPATCTVAARSEGVRRGELVLTNLGRAGSPLIRYRTGCHVAFSRARCACGRDTEVRLQPRGGRQG